jgi:hypothetical protein
MELAHTGEHGAARALFVEIWAELEPDGDPFHRCAVAHAMADLQDDAKDELTWDLRALRAADLLTDERVAAGGVAGSVRGFYASLHLNLADVYLRLGDRLGARHHVVAGREALGALGDDGYEQMIFDALARVKKELDSAERLAHVGERRKRDRCRAR